MKRLSSLTALATMLTGGLVCPAHATLVGDLSDLRDSQGQSSQYYDLTRSRFPEIDPSDRPVIEEYYERLQFVSMARPMMDSMELASSRGEDLVDSVEKALNKMGTSRVRVKQYLRSDLNDLKEAVRNLREQGERLGQDLARNNFRSLNQQLQSSEIREAIRKFEKFSRGGMSDAFVDACNNYYAPDRRDEQTRRTAAQMAAMDGRVLPPDTPNAKEEEMLNGGCDEAAEGIKRAESNLDRPDYPILSEFNDPTLGLSIAETPHSMATFLRSPSVRSQLRNIYADNKNADDIFWEEAALWADLDSSCKKEVKRQQKEANGALKVLGLAGLNATLCHLLPAYSTHNFKSGTHKLVTGTADIMSMLPFRKLQCDPRETAIYKQMRPDDINVIADKWGIPQLQNPVYIQQLRTILPHQMPSDLFVGAGYGVGTPYGTVGGLAIEDYLSEETKQTLRLNQSTAVSSSTRYRPPSNSNPASSGRRQIRYRRVLTADAGTSVANTRAGNVSRAIRGVRSLSSAIREGGSKAQRSARSLSLGASKTRSLTESVQTKARSLGPSGIRKQRRQLSAKSRGLMARYLNASAARTSAEQIARGINRSPNNTSRTSPEVETVRNEREQKKQNEANRVAEQNQSRRKNLQAQSQLLFEAMERAAKRSEELTKEIRRGVAMRDRLINETVESFAEEAPKYQADHVISMQNQLVQVDRNLSVLKMQYDTAGASIGHFRQQIYSLGGFNPQPLPGLASNNPVSPNTGRAPASFGGRAGSGNFVPNDTDRALLGTENLKLPAPPRANVPVDEVAQNNLLKIFRLENLFASEAFASSRLPGMSFEQAWEASWLSYQKEWKAYVKLLRKKEQQSREAILQHYLGLQKVKSDGEAFVEPSAEMLSLMKHYSQSLEEEAGDLIEDARLNESVLDDSQTRSLIETTHNDAKESQGHLAEYTKLYWKAYPKSYLDNAEAWEAFLPSAVIHP